MHKNDLIDQLAKDCSVPRPVVANVINRMIELVSDEVANGDKVVITGFGTFELRYRRSRRGVDPRTAAEITVPETYTPGFTASTTFKSRVQRQRRNQDHDRAAL